MRGYGGRFPCCAGRVGSSRAVVEETVAPTVAAR